MVSWEARHRMSRIRAAAGAGDADRLRAGGNDRGRRHQSGVLWAADATAGCRTWSSSGPRTSRSTALWARRPSTTACSSIRAGGAGAVSPARRATRRCAAARTERARPAPVPPRVRARRAWDDRRGADGGVRAGAHRAQGAAGPTVRDAGVEAGQRACRRPVRASTRCASRCRRRGEGRTVWARDAAPLLRLFDDQERLIRQYVVEPGKRLYWVDEDFPAEVPR